MEEKLEQACLISTVKKYDIATKRTLKHIENQFVGDNGLLLAFNNSNKIFVAHALENLVYNELLYRGYDVKIGKTYNCLYNLKRNLKMLVFLFTKRSKKKW